MKKLKGWLVLGGLALLAGTAGADFNVQDHGTHYQNASTGLKTDVNGNLATQDFDRDRDFPLITNLFAGQQLAHNQAYQMPIGVPMMQYTRAAIMLTWAAAAADSDSVRIAVRVYGATSATSANWHLWTPMTTYSPSVDSCLQSGTAAGDSGLSSTGRCPKPVSFWVTRNTGVEMRPRIAVEHASLYQGAAIAGTGMVALRKLFPWSVRWGSANGVMLPLTDVSGAPCPFPYIRIEVFNCSADNNTLASGAAGTLTNVEANLWPRVQ